MRHWFPAFLLLTLMVPAGAEVATPTIDDNTAGQGFFDTTEIVPAGGNAAILRGQARLNAVLRAALIYDRHIGFSASPLQLRISAAALGGSATSATLAYAGPAYMVAGFPGSDPDTAYPIALGNDLKGSAISPGADDITCTLNQDVDNATVLGAVSWYYGFDRQSGTDIDLIDTLLHELMHGLGFMTVLQQDGSVPPLPGSATRDVFMPWLEYHGVGQLTDPAMDNPTRAAAQTSDTLLHWTGPQVRSIATTVLAGGDGRTGDHVLMYAPTTYDSGSSVSHFDIRLSPDALMEPYATATSQACLGMALLRDIGWTMDGTDNGIFDATDLSLSAQITAGANTANPTLTLRIDNASTVAVRHAYLTLALPVGLTASGPAGCSSLGAMFRCALGTIPASGNTQLDVVLTDGSGNPATQTLRLNVSSPHAESVPADNTLDFDLVTGSGTHPALGGTTASNLDDPLGCSLASGTGSGGTSSPPASGSSGGGGGGAMPWWALLPLAGFAWLRRRALACVALSAGLAGCGGGNPEPPEPTSPPEIHAPVPHRSSAGSDARAVQTPAVSPAGHRKALIDPETGKLVAPSRERREQPAETAQDPGDEQTQGQGTPEPAPLGPAHQLEDGTWIAPLNRQVQ